MARPTAAQTGRSPGSWETSGPGRSAQAPWRPGTPAAAASRRRAPWRRPSYWAREPHRSPMRRPWPWGVRGRCRSPPGRWSCHRPAGWRRLFQAGWPEGASPPSERTRASGLPGAETWGMVRIWPKSWRWPATGRPSSGRPGRPTTVRRTRRCPRPARPGPDRRTGPGRTCRRARTRHRSGRPA